MHQTRQPVTEGGIEAAKPGVMLVLLWQQEE